MEKFAGLISLSSQRLPYGEENRESEKTDYVDAETQKEKDSKKRSGEEKSTMDAEKLVKKLKRRYLGADELTICRLSVEMTTFVHRY